MSITYCKTANSYLLHLLLPPLTSFILPPRLYRSQPYFLYSFVDFCCILSYTILHNIIRQNMYNLDTFFSIFFEFFQIIILGDKNDKKYIEKKGNKLFSHTIFTLNCNIKYIYTSFNNYEK